MVVWGVRGGGGETGSERSINRPWMLESLNISTVADAKYVHILNGKVLNYLFTT